MLPAPNSGHATLMATMSRTFHQEKKYPLPRYVNWRGTSNTSFSVHVAAIHMRACHANGASLQLAPAHLGDGLP
jgi:hypothetical protein